MTEVDLENLKHRVSVRDDMEPHFAIKVGLLILAELATAIYRVAGELSSLSKRFV
jgi:hypothetical protein